MIEVIDRRSPACFGDDMVLRLLLSIGLVLALATAPIAEASAIASPAAQATAPHEGCADHAAATVACHKSCAVCAAALPASPDLPTPGAGGRTLAGPREAAAPDWSSSLDPPPPR